MYQDQKSVFEAWNKRSIVTGWLDNDRDINLYRQNSAGFILSPLGASQLRDWLIKLTEDGHIPK